MVFHFCDLGGQCEIFNSGNLRGGSVELSHEHTYTKTRKAYFQGNESLKAINVTLKNMLAPRIRTIPVSCPKTSAHFFNFNFCPFRNETKFTINL